MEPEIATLIEARPATGFRWTICALIFFATTVNYLDRQLFSLLVPFFEDDLRLGPTDLALINVSFILPYGFAMIFLGRLIDRVGVKRGLAGSFLVWNIASLGHAFVRSLTGFMGIRFLLGLGESGMYPSGVKTMTDWFPARERSLATGYFNAGANLGAVLAPLLGVQIALQFGWRMCFVITGSIGIVWIFFWNRYYDSPEKSRRVSESELALIRSDHEASASPISFAQLLAMRPIYALALAKALSDAPWWFYLTWVPKFLVDQFKVTPAFMGFAIPVVYVVADLGSVAGGWMSSRLITRGMAVGRARKLTMLACAIAVLPVMAVGPLVGHTPIAGVEAVYWAVALLSLAAGAHQGWSCNLFTLISDTVPRQAIAMGVGAINGGAMIGVAAMQFFVGRSVQLTSSYTWPFVVAGGLYLVALVCLQVMLPHVHLFPSERRASIPLVSLGTAAFLMALGWLLYTTNRPPYATMSDYLAQRGRELHSTHDALGPTAHVGWMEAQWVLWTAGAAPPKLDLVKFDNQSRPIVEAKGANAPKYRGPGLPQVRSAFRLGR